MHSNSSIICQETSGDLLSGHEYPEPVQAAQTEQPCLLQPKFQAMAADSQAGSALVKDSNLDKNSEDESTRDSETEEEGPSDASDAGIAVKEREGEEKEVAKVLASEQRRGQCKCWLQRRHGRGCCQPPLWVYTYD